jgi:Xaa-Pro aminopeptidase
MLTRGFSTAEFEARLLRAQSIMAEDGFDALVVCSPQNVRYFSGFDTQFWESPTRPWFMVVPAGGAPIAVIPEIGAPAMASTWVKDIRTWPSPVPDDDGTSLLALVLSGLPRRTGRIGFELGREHTLRMPVVEFFALRDRLPGLELTNGSTCLWRIRMVKSAAEVEKIRHICAIASEAYENVPNLLSATDTEREASRKLRIDLARRGADSTPFLPCISGPGGVDQIICGPRDRAFEDGDVVFFDTGSTYDGYFCDFDRNYSVGRLPDAALRAQEAVWEATEVGLKAARPGATTEEVFRAMAKVTEAAGSLGSNVGRSGHGLGMMLTEPPSHMLGDRTPITPGMVLTIEPGMEYAPGKLIVHEENVVITDDGAELLTKRAPREMQKLS